MDSCDRPHSTSTLNVAPVEQTAPFARLADGPSMSTATALVQQLDAFLKDPVLGPCIVLILAASARRLGITDSLGLHHAEVSPHGRDDDAPMPGDAGGELSSWMAAATKAITHGTASLPFYIHARESSVEDVGILTRAAADARVRGFLINMAPCETAHSGDGVHCHGDVNQLVASTIVNCRSYSPAFAAELAVIVDHGVRRMLVEQREEFYYLSVTDEMVDNPGLPVLARDDVIRGMHRLRQGAAHGQRVQLLGGGAGMREVLQAAAELEQVHGIAADVWSVTSYVELARQGRAQERNWIDGTQGAVESWFEQQMSPTDGPIVAAAEGARALPEMLRAFIPPGRRYVTLGTDDPGRADTSPRSPERSDVDAAMIVKASLRAIQEIQTTEKALEQRQLADLISLASI